MADIACGSEGEDHVDMRNWHPSSTPLSFYCVEAGKLKTTYPRFLAARVWFANQSSNYTPVKEVWKKDVREGLFSLLLLLLLLANRCVVAGASSSDFRGQGLEVMAVQHF